MTLYRPWLVHGLFLFIYDSLFMLFLHLFCLFLLYLYTYILYSILYNIPYFSDFSSFS